MKRLLSGIQLMGLMILLAGCGSSQINELGFVTAVGLDTVEESKDIRVTVQIIRPADARGQTGAPSGGTGEPIYSASAEGRSLFEAIRNLARISSRRIYWAHNFIIVMSEKYARAGISDMIDFFTRNHELRMNTWVAVTSGSAGEAVSTVTGLEVVPGEAINKLFYYNRIVSEAPRVNMMRLQETYLNESSSPVLPRLEIRNRGISNKKPEQFGSIKQLELSGAAAFRHDKMVGWLSPKESRSLLFFIEKLKSAIIAVDCPDKKNYATLEVRGYKFRVKPLFVNDEPRFQISLTVKTDIVEAACGKSLKNMKGQLENNLEKELHSAFTKLLDQSQHNYKTDILKLGEVFQNRYPQHWNKLRNRWDELYPTIKVDVTVKARITHTVLKTGDFKKVR